MLRLWIVVALDEFQELAGLSPKDFALFARLRSVWQRHRRVAYFISGSARSMLLALVTEEASPFFQHFSILELGPFNRDAAIELLRRPGPGSRCNPREVHPRLDLSFKGRHSGFANGECRVSAVEQSRARRLSG